MEVGPGVLVAAVGVPVPGVFVAVAVAVDGVSVGTGVFVGVDGVSVGSGVFVAVGVPVEGVSVGSGVGVGPVGVTVGSGVSVGVGPVGVGVSVTGGVSVGSGVLVHTGGLDGVPVVTRFNPPCSTVCAVGIVSGIITIKSNTNGRIRPAAAACGAAFRRETREERGESRWGERASG